EIRRRKVNRLFYLVSKLLQVKPFVYPGYFRRRGKNIQRVKLDRARWRLEIVLTWLRITVSDELSLRRDKDRSLAETSDDNLLNGCLFRVFRLVELRPGNLHTVERLVIVQGADVNHRTPGERNYIVVIVVLIQNLK